ncbi:MAG: LexA family transcriptional regulator [Saprospiraceae bacterium]
MSLFSENIRHLRAQKGFSQQKLADELIITRARLSKYEEAKSEPPLDILKRIAQYFHVSIDVLISVNLSKVSIEQLLKMEDNRILLPITVDQSGADYIEILPHKAKAGYLAGYSDPEFIEKLQNISLPFLSNGKFRAFPVEGDSMPPHKEGSFIIARYIEHLSQVKDGRTYIILSRNEGIVYKRVVRKGKKDNIFTLQSDNPFYKPYEINANEILEIWEYACSLATTEFQPNDLNYESIRDMFMQLRTEIGNLRS